MGEPALVTRFDPYYRNHMWTPPGWDHPTKYTLFNQKFGRNYNISKKQKEDQDEDWDKSGISQIKITKDHFEVTLDVQHFQPNDLDVRTVGNYLIIEGHHEEREDDDDNDDEDGNSGSGSGGGESGLVCRTFKRRYILPPGHQVKPQDITCNISTDGFLTIIIPKEKNAAALEAEAERKVEKSIPINQQASVE